MKMKQVLFIRYGLNHFSYESHFEHDNTTFIQGPFPLSEEMDIYAAEQRGAIRVKDSEIEIIGQCIFNFPLKDSEIG